MVDHNVYLTACHVALTSLTTGDREKIENAYRIINELHNELPPFEQCMTESFTADDLYDYEMYTFAEMELAIYQNDFKLAVFHLSGIITVADICYKKYPNNPNRTTWLIYNLHRRSGVRFWEYFNKLGKKLPAEHTCALCKAHEPDKTGSHLVPELLIKNWFPRWKELAIAENLAKGESYGYVGRNHASHIEEIRGHEMRDEERDMERSLPNPLVRDHLICCRCESRFTRIETLMLKTREKQLAKLPYEPKIPYLFWLSIIWRMSVGKMSVKLSEDVEEHIRVILDRSLPQDDKDDFHWENVETCFHYGIAYTEDVREEALGITGTHSNVSPKVIAIGNLILTFFENDQQVEEFRKLDPYLRLNNGTAPEMVDLLEFKTYWDRRQFIAMHNAEYDATHLGGSDMVDVYMPHPSIHHRRYLTDKDCRIDPGDYASLRGMVPFPIPWSLRDIWDKIPSMPELDCEKLAEGTPYSAEEVAFMLGQYAFRQKELVDHVLAYYAETGLDMKKLNFVPTMKTGKDGTTYILFNPDMDYSEVKLN